jgi:hypothetical protein
MRTNTSCLATPLLDVTSANNDRSVMMALASKGSGGGRGGLGREVLGVEL